MGGKATQKGPYPQLLRQHGKRVDMAGNGLEEQVRSTDEAIRFRLRQVREAKGLSLRDLAEKVNLSSSFLSQVELGKSSLSVRSLLAIAEALDMTLADLCLDKEDEGEAAADASAAPRGALPDRSPVVRADQRAKLLLSSPDLMYELLVPSLGRKLISILGRLAPGTGNIARRLPEPTEETLFVLSGALRVGLDQGEYVLHAGDSMYIDGPQLQLMECASDEEVVWISSLTPAVF